MIWQELETAPQDGTEILAYREDCGVIIARWCAPVDFATEQELSEIDEDTAETADWFCADFVCGHRLEGSETPTHWMPLPEPPHGV